MRCFVAIDLPDEIKAKLINIVEKLQKSGIIVGSFPKKDDFHLTLEFLGDLNEEQINNIKSTLKNIHYNRFDATASDVGVFPSVEYVRVIWVGVHSAELLALQSLVESNIKKLGFENKRNEFHSHITISRVKHIKKSKENKKVFINLLKELSFKDQVFSVDAVHLYKSELTAKGPIYKKIESFPLV
jgi:2'-5' RNA ligase